jgi:hypothetical protein
MTQEAELRLERSFDRQDILKDALTLKYGPTAAGIILALALVMEHAGKAHAVTDAWDDVPEGAALWDTDPNRWHQLSSMKWTDDPRSRQIGMLAGVVALVMLPEINIISLGERIWPKLLMRHLLPTIEILRLLRMKELPDDVSNVHWLSGEIAAARSLLSPDIPPRSDALMSDDAAHAVRALRTLADVLCPIIDAMPKEPKP